MKPYKVSILEFVIIVVYLLKSIDIPYGMKPREALWLKKPHYGGKNTAKTENKTEKLVATLGTGQSHLLPLFLYVVL